MRRRGLGLVGAVGTVGLCAGLILPVGAGAAEAATGSGGAVAPAAVGGLSNAQAAPLAANATDPVVVVFKDQVPTVPATSTQVPARRAAVAGVQQPVVSELQQLHAPDLHTYSLLNAVSAKVSPAEAARLSADSSVAEVIPDQSVRLDFTAPPGAGATRAAPAAGSSPAATAPAPVPACQAGSSGVELDPQALEAIHANSNLPGSGPTAASLGITGAGVKVGFIAEGFDVNQPNFIRNNGQKVFFDEQDFTGEGIGTASGGEASLDASSIAAQGNVDYTVPLTGGGSCKFIVEGAAPGASLAGYKVFANNYLATTSSILQAIDYAVTVDQVNVLNESFGYNPLPDTTTDVVRQADEAAVAAGVVVDVSTGDAGPTSTVGSPSTDPAVISAGASTTYRVYAQEQIAPTGVAFNGWEDDNLSGLSSGGFTEGLQGADVLAPGDLNWVTCNPSAGSYGACISGGTSEAAPLTSATAALVIQAYRQTHGGSTPTPALVKQIITSTATDLGLPADQQGNGLINSYQAVLAAESVKTPAGSPTAKGMTIQSSPNYITATAPAGTTVTQPVTLTNTGSGAQTVQLSGRILSDPTTVASGRYTAGAASYQKVVTFKVAPGTSFLEARAATTSDDPNSFTDIDLVDPLGRLANDALPQGATLTSNAEVRYPGAGTWTAYITYQGATAPTAPIAFQASTQDWQPFGTVTPSSVTLYPGTSKTVAVAVTTPANAGDETAAVQITSPFGQPASIPIALRSLVALSSGSGTFSAQVFGGNGRSGSPATTQYFQFDLPAGTPELNVATTLAHATTTDYSLLVVSPTGEALGHASNQLDVGGTPANPVTVTETGATSHVLAPAAGRWTVIVALSDPTSGTSVSSVLNGSITTSAVAVKATGVPSGSVTAGSSDVVAVTVKNSGSTPQAYFLDPRLTKTVTQSLKPYASTASVTLPLANAAAIPQFIVPTDTTSLLGQLDATAPATFDMSPYLGNYGGELNGDPQITATSTGDSATATWSDSPVTPGDWNLDPALVGEWEQQGAPAASGTVSMQATTRAFDSTVSTTYGDLWQNGSVSPVIVGPGQTTTLYAVVTPTKAGAVSGDIFVDTAAVQEPFGSAIPVGDQVAAVPYSYTVTSAG